LAPRERESHIVVVGTFAVGVTLRTERLPDLGETLHGSGLAVGYGGKGSNQAIACARLGVPVELVSCLGRDSFGEMAQALYRTEGVGAGQIGTSDRFRTGLGAILVIPDGRNAIVVDIGANREMDAKFVEDRASVFEGASVLLTVTEAPIEAVSRAVELAWSRKIPVVLNPAPAVPLSSGTLSKISALTPNAAELKTLTGRDTSSPDAAAEAAKTLLNRGVAAVVVTLGEMGALVCTTDGVTHIPAPQVNVVDTTGAGDAFAAGLSVALSEGATLQEAARFAVCCGSLACTVEEVVPSLPTRARVQEMLG
jgi:ribokinase